MISDSLLKMTKDSLKTPESKDGKKRIMFEEVFQEDTKRNTSGYGPKVESYVVGG